MNRLLRLATLVTAVTTLNACTPGSDPAAGGPGSRRKTVIRLGHFPNVTHAQALVAHALSRQGKGWFEERLGPDVKVEWFVYNAGPGAMEAILAGSLDATYVGPNPALNAHIKSRGEEIRIIAGAARGGAALVVQGDGRIKAPADFRGKKVATPQLGNTQDVACRAWLMDQGYKITQLGGDVHVVPTQNPDQLALFQKGELDAVWTVEPWVSRLEMEAGGKVYLEEKDALTTILASSAALVRDHAELAKKLLAAHQELTEWIRTHPDEAKRLVREELKVETTKEMPQDLLERSWGRLELNSTIELDTLQKFLAAARRVGFLSDVVELSRMVVNP